MIILKDFELGEKTATHVNNFDATTLRLLQTKCGQYQMIMVPLSESESYIFFIFADYDRNLIKDKCKWLKINEKFIKSLMTFLDSFHDINANISEGNTIHSSMDNSTIEQKEILDRLTALFESELLKRYVRKNCDDLWDEFGVSEFKRAMWYYVENEQPVLFLLPAFPFKSSNTGKKVIGTLPDLGERLALERLEKFLISFQTIYTPGARLVMFSDGRVYCDLFGISDETTSKFKWQIRRTYVSDLISWSDLDIVFSNFEDDDKRVALVNLFGTTMENIAVEIENDSDFRETYCGFKKFMTEELILPEGIGNRHGRKIITNTARGLMMRNYSYGRLMKVLFPHHVRLSIHPSKCLKKFSVNLVGKTDWGTPWHNCALLQPDGTFSLIRKKTADQKRFKLSKTGDGLPFYINDSGEMCLEKL